MMAPAASLCHNYRPHYRFSSHPYLSPRPCMKGMRGIPRPVPSSSSCPSPPFSGLPVPHCHREGQACTRDPRPRQRLLELDRHPPRGRASTPLPSVCRNGSSREFGQGGQHSLLELGIHPARESLRPFPSVCLSAGMGVAGRLARTTAPIGTRSPPHPAREPKVLKVEIQMMKLNVEETCLNINCG